MILVIAFSGGRQPKEKPPAKTPAVQPVDPNEQRIQEYRARIDAQAQKLAAEQAELAQAKQVFAKTNGPLAINPPTKPMAAFRGFPTHARPRARKAGLKRIGKSASISRVLSPTLLSATANKPRQKRQRMFQLDRPEVVTIRWLLASMKKPQNPCKPDPQLQRAEGQKYRLFEGTVIETVLTNRLDGSFSGPVNWMVTTNVYSHDRQHVLIPQAAVSWARSEALETFGQQRLAVCFTGSSCRTDIR